MLGHSCDCLLSILFVLLFPYKKPTPSLIDMVPSLVGLFNHTSPELLSLGQNLCVPSSLPESTSLLHFSISINLSSLSLSLSMIPFYQEQFPSLPLAEKDQDQTHLSLSTQADNTSFSCPISYNTPQAQEASYKEDHQYHHQQQRQQQQEANKLFPIGGSSGRARPFPTDNKNYSDVERSSNNQYIKMEDAQGSAKWMSSKMRFMRKMMDSDRIIERKPRRSMQALRDQQQPSQESGSYVTNNPSGIIRVCSDCNTTKTPLWRSGPSGPKSLCNACGIRQRKARRAMAVAAAASNGFAPATPPEVQKEKRSEDHTLPYKKRCKITGSRSSEKKLFFEDITIKSTQNSAFHGVFPQDEREAAILLMALSCGLIHG